MNEFKWPGALRGLALVVSAVCAMPAAQASGSENSIFPRIEPLLRDRAFMRLNYIHANVKTTSGDAYDVTGPVVGRNDIGTYLGTDAGGGYVSMFYRGTAAQVAGNTAPRMSNFIYDSAQAALLLGLDGDLPIDGCVTTSTAGLGTPCGVRARSSATLGTPAVSVGYYLDEGRNWVAEAFLLAAPLKAEVYGQGNNQLNGKNIINLKILPPTAVLGRYFGDKNARIRPFVGLGGSYAVFFDAKSTRALDDYQGGKTAVSVKNALGFGPFFGVKAQLDDDWHFSLNIGKLSYRTEATLTTYDTKITAESLVIRDYGPQTAFINTTTINSTLVPSPTSNTKLWAAPASGGVPQVAGFAVGTQVAPLTALMCDLARAKYGNNECNQGTFVRKQKTKLDNTMFMFSVGRRF